MTSWKREDLARQIEDVRANLAMAETPRSQRARLIVKALVLITAGVALIVLVA